MKNLDVSMLVNFSRGNDIGQHIGIQILRSACVGANSGCMVLPSSSSEYVLIFLMIFIFAEPYLYMSGHALSRILERCSWTTGSYVPLPWLTTGFAHVKALLGRNATIEAPSYEREFLLAPNSSTVAIDWYEHPENITKVSHGLLVFFNHGLNGPISNRIIESATRVASAYHMSLCVVSIQGVNGVSLSSMQTGLGLSFVIEMKAATERINQHLGLSFPKAAFGLSIGGAPVLEFLEQEKSTYSSLILISCPLDLERFGMMESELSDLLVSEGKKVVQANSDTLTKSNVEEVTKALEASNVNDLLANVACKEWGHPSTASLYQFLDPYSCLHRLTKPTLLFYALDDESIDFFACIDLIRLCRNPNIAVAVTEVGGHCAFQTFGQDWLMDCVCDFASSSFKPVI